MPTTVIDNFNIVCSTLGAFIALFGLVSYLCKETFYLSETLISLVAGAIFSPNATNLIRPLQYAVDNQETLNSITLYFARLVLGIQLVIAGVQLPSKYLQTEWKSLAYLLGPGMVAMWICTSLIIWALVPNFGIVYALAVGACVTPTDPVLASNIVKGKFADKNIPKELQNIIIAESGANDGLGYPFLFLPLYLIQYVSEGGLGSDGNVGTVFAKWFYEIWAYQILLGIVYGASVGWIAKELLHWAERNKYVDRESFIVFAIALALFIVGTAGLIGTDDVLACFIAGNTFTWDDWFRLETQDDTLQPTIDMLLNVSFFIWIGAVAPWKQFADNSVIPLYRLAFIGVLVLLFRRLPFVLAIHSKIHQIEQWRQAAFVGFFGPIGVSAVFYLYIAIDFLDNNVRYQGEEREDAKRASEVINIVVWFLVICSVLVHGLTIPVGKLGLYLPRTLSRAISTHSEPAVNLQPVATSLDHSNAGSALAGRLFRIGGSVVSERRRYEHEESGVASPASAKTRTPAAASSTISLTPSRVESPTYTRNHPSTLAVPPIASRGQSSESFALGSLPRTIKFGDDQVCRAEPQRDSAEASAHEANTGEISKRETVARASAS